MFDYFCTMASQEFSAKKRRYLDRRRQTKYRINFKLSITAVAATAVAISPLTALKCIQIENLNININTSQI